MKKDDLPQYKKRPLQAQIIAIQWAIDNNIKGDDVAVWEASHLCHHSWCVEKGHIILESPTRNRLRAKCARAKKCVCGLEVKCIFNRKV